MQVTSKRAAVVLAAGATALVGATFTGISRSDAATGAAGATRCSISTVPTLEVDPAAQTTLSPVVPYVLVCVDAAGHELVNEVVLITSSTAQEGPDE